MTSTILFIHSLLNGDIHTFAVKTGVVVLFWVLCFLATIIDLYSGISASKRVANAKTNSLGLRRTVIKIQQYIQILFLLLIIDIILSSLSEYVSFFQLPIFSVIGTISIVFIETLSVIENNKKGRNKSDYVYDDMSNAAKKIIQQIGDRQLNDFVEAYNNYNVKGENKKKTNKRNVKSNNNKSNENEKK